MNKNILQKHFHFDIKTVDQPEGCLKGLFSGFASTSDLDRDGDIVLPTAFISSLIDHKERKKEFIKLLFNHDSNVVLGGIPVDQVEITENGFHFNNAFLDLNVQKAKEVYSLLKNKILSEMSIGFQIVDSEFKPSDDEESLPIQVIKDIILYEVSIVTEPANTKAVVTAVKLKKSVPKFNDLPLTDVSRPWDSEAAIKRIRAFTDSIDLPSRQYRDAFLFFDSAKSDTFGAYKLPFVDVIDDKFHAVPRGIFAAAAALQGARGGVTGIPDDEIEKIKTVLNKYYDKMDRDSPFEDGEKSHLVDIEKLDSLKKVEKTLNTYGFSKKESLTLISVMKSIMLAGKNTDQSDFDFIESINSIKLNLNKIKGIYNVRTNQKR